MKRIKLKDKLLDTSSIYDGSNADTLDNILKNDGWIKLTALNGSWSYLEYRKQGNVVEVRGYCTSYTFSNTKVCTLPLEARPRQQVYFFGFSSNKRVARIYIQTGGVLGFDWIYDMATNEDVTSSAVGWFRFNFAYTSDY